MAPLILHPLSTELSELRPPFFSPQIKELLGYEPEAILGKTILDLMPREEALRAESAFKTRIAGHEPFYRIEHTCARKEGSLRVLETSGAPMVDACGGFVGYRGKNSRPSAPWPEA